MRVTVYKDYDWLLKAADRMARALEAAPLQTCRDVDRLTARFNSLERQLHGPIVPVAKRHEAMDMAVRLNHAWCRAMDDPTPDYP